MHPHLRLPAPHDGTMTGFATLEFQHEFSGTKRGAGGHQLSSDIRHIDDLAAHAAMSVVEDNESVFQHLTTWLTTPLGHLLLGHLYVMHHLHCCRPVSTILEIQRP